jgi:hypothetical protein
LVLRAVFRIVQNLVEIKNGGKALFFSCQN